MNQPQLSLTNTLSKRRELFEPRTQGRVLMYVCGITPYDHPHLGHARCYVTFDVLYRLLMFLNYQVTYTRNFTDIDDKLLNRAQTEFGNPMRYGEIAQRYIESFTNNMQALGCLPPTHEPRATQTIDAIITFVQELIDRGHAYVVDNDVYFAVRTFKNYGKLSGRKLDDLLAGARVEISEKKRDPLDFALWKGEPDGTFWKSPWGYGRPGWHIECSAMAVKYLATNIDIHGGGMDLIFPHHENEVAQSESLYDAPFARYWVHNAFVRINKEKMSKSLGNFFTIHDILTQIDAMALRFYLLNHNYTIPLDFSLDSLLDFQKAYKRLCNAFKNVQTKSATYKDIAASPYAYTMLEFLADDLNAAGMLGFVFEHMDDITNDSQHAQAAKAIFTQVLGLTLTPLAEKNVEITPEIQKLLEQREQARAQKNWKLSDELREKLHLLGIDVQDRKTN